MFGYDVYESLRSASCLTMCYVNSRWAMYLPVEMIYAMLKRKSHKQVQAGSGWCMFDLMPRDPFSGSAELCLSATSPVFRLVSTMTTSLWRRMCPSMSTCCACCHAASQK